MELEDQPWFPTFLRDQQTAFIGFVAGTFGVYKPLIFQLKVLLKINIEEPWTDCCSGSAGPILSLLRNVNFENDVLLTDKFPNKNFIENAFSKVAYLNIPLDVLKDEVPNNGLVTMFNAFHHFNMEERVVIIKKLIKANRPFLIAEILQPTMLDALKIFITATVGQLLLAPFVKPFSLNRLLFTYIIPLNIITVLWDGIVSVMRAIPFYQLKNLAESVNSNGFEVEAIKHKTTMAVITYLVGKPILNG